jgi:hypothetical protein
MKTDLADDLLVAVLDVLLPGDADFPAASAVALASRLLDHPAFAEAARAGVARLSPDFLGWNADRRTAAVAEWEGREPALFARLVTAAYSSYYSCPAVLKAVEEVCGYAARPPQPEGYRLPPFDAALLRVPSSRPAHYRRVPETPPQQ